MQVNSRGVNEYCIAICVATHHPNIPSSYHCTMPKWLTFLSECTVCTVCRLVLSVAHTFVRNKRASLQSFLLCRGTWTEHKTVFCKTYHWNCAWIYPRALVLASGSKCEQVWIYTLWWCLRSNNIAVLKKILNLFPYILIFLFWTLNLFWVPNICPVGWSWFLKLFTI